MSSSQYYTCLYHRYIINPKTTCYNIVRACVCVFVVCVCCVCAVSSTVSSHLTLSLDDEPDLVHSNPEQRPESIAIISRESHHPYENRYPIESSKTTFGIKVHHHYWDRWCVGGFGRPLGAGHFAPRHQPNNCIILSSGSDPSVFSSPPSPGRCFVVPGTVSSYLPAQHWA